MLQCNIPPSVIKSFQYQKKMLGNLDIREKSCIFVVEKNKQERLMFSGIIEGMARVVAIEHEQDNVHLTLTCPFVSEPSRVTMRDCYRDL